MKYYIVIEDLQGGNFGMGRVYTEEQWREQALEWAEIDENDEFIEILNKISTDKIIPFISEMWALEFNELNEEDYKCYLQGIEDYKELKNIVENWKGNSEDLAKLVGGYNWDNGLFDCNYKGITATIVFLPSIRLCENFDIWGKEDMIIENYTL